MKKVKLLSGLAVTALSAVTMFSSVTMAYAGEETKELPKKMVMDCHNIVGRAYLEDEDAVKIAELMGYDDISDGICIMICDEDSSAQMDWESSDIKLNAICVYNAMIIPFSRDEDNNNLVVPVSPDNSLIRNPIGVWSGNWEFQETGGEGYFWFKLDGPENRIGNPEEIKKTQLYPESEFYESFQEAYYIRLGHKPDGSAAGIEEKINYDDCSYTDFWFIYKDSLETSNLKFKNIDYDNSEVSYNGVTHQGKINDDINNDNPDNNNPDNNNPDNNNPDNNNPDNNNPDNSVTDNDTTDSDNNVVDNNTNNDITNNNSDNNTESDDKTNDNSDNDSVNNNDKGQNNSDKNNNLNQQTPPKTGDTASILIYFIISLSVAGVIFVVRGIKKV